MVNDESDSSTTTRPLRDSEVGRYLRHFVILNSVLLGIPVIVAMVVYVLLALNGVWLNGVTGNIGSDVTLILAGYIFLPNLILVSIGKLRDIRKRDVHH